MFGKPFEDEDTEVSKLKGLRTENRTGTIEGFVPSFFRVGVSKLEALISNWFCLAEETN